MSKESNPQFVVREIRGKIRGNYSSEKKIPIVLEGLRKSSALTPCQDTTLRSE